MKKYKTDKNGKFVCEECKKKSDDKNSLFVHIFNEHPTIKAYLEKYIFDASTNA